MATRFEEVVRHGPDRLAVKSRGRALSYGELDVRANRIANALLRSSEDRGVPVALLAEDRGFAVAGYLAAFKAARPALHLDPSLPNERLLALLADARATAIVADAGHEALARSLAATRGLPCLERADYEGGDDRAPRLAISPEAPAVVVYTSGSTGEPRGVVQGQRLGLFSALFHGDAHALGPHDRYVILAAPGFGQFLEAMHAALLNGCALFPFDVEREGFHALRDLLNEERITVYQSVPALFRQFVRSLPADDRFPTVRVVRLGGDRVLPEDVARFRGRFGSDAVLRVGYAASESGPMSFETVDLAEARETGTVPVGRTHPLVDVTLLDDDRHPVPAGETGEIAVSSPGLALGYWNRPELTQERFLERGDGMRTLLTRDLGRFLPDGRLVLVGRADDRVKLRGFGVDLGEVETAIRRLAGVADAAVAVHEAADGGRALTGFVVPSGEALPPDRLRAALAERLPAYMIPSGFVNLDAIPLNPRGKVDRRLLVAPPRPVSGGSGRLGDPLEERLGEVFGRVLGVDRVDPDESFFALGGDSLLALRLAFELEAILDRHVSPSQLLEASSVRRLARLLREEGRGRSSPLVPIQPLGSEIPLFCVHPAGGEVLVYTGLARRLGSNRPVFGLRRERHADGSPLHTRIEEMAESYARAICEARPGGPFLVAGLSVGGTIAFEVGRRLAEQGGRVAAVVLFDPRLPHGSLPGLAGPLPELRERLRGAGNRVAFHVSAWRLLGAGERLPYVRRIMVRALDRRRGEAAPEALVPPDGGVRGLVERGVANRFDPYLPKPYYGRTILFRARLQPERYVGDRSLGFGGAALGPFEIHEVAGVHSFILEEPFLRALAPLVSDALRRAVADGRG